MTRFRPCIDLHAGAVKQIVGGTLAIPPPSTLPSTSGSSSPTTTTTTTPKPTSSTDNGLQTNHISPHSAAHFARLYRDLDLRGGHMIMLGPGNEAAAREALAAWPGGLQVGGGIRGSNDADDTAGPGTWIRAGASKVILTSYLFPDGLFSRARLDRVLADLGGRRESLVVDLSCRRVTATTAGTSTSAGAGGGVGEGADAEEEGKQVVKWFVAMDKWQRVTDVEVCQETIDLLRSSCSELLIHAADVEGLQTGIDEALVRQLGRWGRAADLPVTYAGGAASIADLDRVKRLSGGWVDLTIGSALDVFGGRGVRLSECVEWNRGQDREEKKEKEKEEGR